MSMIYTATVQVTLPHLVRCAHCGTEYVYERQLTGAGSCESSLFTSEATAKKTAEEAARAELDRRAGKIDGFDPVPCRHCHRYQPYMHEKIATKRFEALKTTANVCIAIGIFATFAGFIAWNAVAKADQWIAILIGVGGLALTSAGIALRSTTAKKIREYDPNEERLGERKRLAAERATLRENYEEVQAIRVREIYKAYQNARSSTRWRGGKQEDMEPLIVGWWVSPALFINGGVIAIQIAENATVMAAVPPDTEHGSVLDAEPDSPTIEQFQVRVLAMRVHPDEYRLE